MNQTLLSDRAGDTAAVVCPHFTGSSLAGHQVRSDVMDTQEKHRFYDDAVSAFSGTSFTPEKRAEQYCADHDGRIEDFREWLYSTETSIDKDAEFLRFKENIDSAFRSFLYAHSRVMSTMITGPANFPVRSNEKRCNTSDKRLAEYLEIPKKAKTSIMKRVKSEQIDAAGGELEIAKKKLESMKKQHEMMKLANKVIRSNPKGERTEEKVQKLIEIGYSKEIVSRLFVPDCFGGVGFATFQLTNSNARIKNTEARIKELEKREEAETKEYSINGYNIVENTDIDRLQIIFEDKPEHEIRQELKKNGFRWSPRESAWQRKLTNNAKYSLRFLSFLKK
jgi:hypothetical protein